MFVPISQYYAYAPQNPIKMRKKGLKPQTQSGENEQSTDEISTEPLITTTPQYDELASLSSSSSSPSSIDHSNINRI